MDTAAAMIGFFAGVAFALWVVVARSGVERNASSVPPTAAPLPPIVVHIATDTSSARTMPAIDVEYVVQPPADRPQLPRASAKLQRWA